MVNTITQTTMVLGTSKVVRHIGITSDGSEETDLVIYDSSVIATALGIADPLTCKLLHLQYSVSSATGFFLLEFDASTDTHCVSIPANSAGDLDFARFGGIKNTAGSGITGDLMLTTTGLAAGDSVTLIIEVSPF